MNVLKLSSQIKGKLGLMLSQTTHAIPFWRKESSMPQHTYQNENIIKVQDNKYPLTILIGFFLLNVLFFPVLLSTLLFMGHISVQPWVFPVSVLLSGILTWLLSSKDFKRTVFALSCGVLCLAVAMLLCTYTYDFSFDGNTYHKGIIGLLKQGWNPLYETFYAYAERFPFLSAATLPWYDAYPKATELWAAAIYATVGTIETGKAFNLLSVFSLVFICWAVLGEIKGLSSKQSAFAAILFSISTVTVIQCFTFYNDSFLWEMVLLFLAALSYLTFFEKGRYRKICYYFIFLSINLGFNVKYSAVIFFGLIGICFFGFWFIERWHTDGFRSAWIYVEERFWILAGSVISGFCLTGSTSYVTNIIRYHNPFYIMIGKDAHDFLPMNVSLAYRPLAHGVRVICSLFSMVSNEHGAADMTNEIKWKLPFTFYASEIGASQSVDTRYSGWGIFFSGIFLISAVCIACYLVYARRKERRVFGVGVMLICLTIVAVLVVPGLFWARYFIGLCYFPAIAFVIICKMKKGNVISGERCNIILTAISVLFCLNLIPQLTKDVEVLNAGKTTREDLIMFKHISDSNDVVVAPTGMVDFVGRYFNLLDAGISNFTYGEVSPEHASSVFSDGWLSYSVQEEVHLPEYLANINYSHNLVFIAAKDDASNAITEDVLNSMHQIGLKFDMVDALRCSYIAVIDEAPVWEEKSDIRIQYGAELEGLKISIESAGCFEGNVASIMLNGREYSRNQRGLNIVVCNRQSLQVIDSVYVDLFADDIVRR